MVYADRIGKPRRVIEIEPLEEPDPTRIPEPEPTEPIEIPEPAPKEPAECSI